LFKNPVRDYKLSLTLTNKDKTDIRRYRIEVTANPKPVKATLEFKVPVRNSTTQDIPIINNTDKEWNIKVTLTGDGKNGHMFSIHNI